MKTYQPKVSTTQKYSDSQGEHIVHESKLLLFGQHELNVHGRAITKGNQVAEIKTIIISETETPEIGDWVYHTSRMQIFKVHHFGESNGSKTFIPEDSLGLPSDEEMLVIDCHKILALPEHFSDKHLQAIVDGKMKDGDEVLVRVKTDLEQYYENGVGGKEKIYLDQQNHITLFPAKQSLEEAAIEYRKITNYFDIESVFKAGAKWAVKNNYKGE